MGVMDRVLGVSDAAGELGEAVEGVSEVFVENATRRMELAAEGRSAAQAAAAAEFAHAGTGRFDRMINGLNRLPRPLLAPGTLGLFVYAMADPVGFATRMRGLAEVPDPLWWLLGAIVSFYFGARELHYFRAPRGLAPNPRAPNPPVADANPALSAWRARSEAGQGDDAP